ncbi:MAG: methylated-DNA--[protein]-cysteine S-methyltransferase [Desulfobacterales bacterium]|nr:methylated-DNA--[protein]-cysteine S-methyltransferase [Desulfobacterales bacterium]
MKPENRVYFSSHEEARASGYRACKVCKPDGQDVEPETFFVSSYDSPLGTYTLVSSHMGVICMEPAEEAGTCLIRWKRDGICLQRGGGYNSALAREIDAYFAGKLRQFTVPLDLRGTVFQLQVWEVLCSIPYGVTRSYREVAQALGNPKATRAVGQAIGSNPVSIVVPCHRVIGSDGRLTGYGGGLNRKKALLNLEAAALPSVAV